MTRKDTALLASALRLARPAFYAANPADPAAPTRDAEQSAAWRVAVGCVARAIQSHHPRFDRAAFERACGKE